MEELTITKKSGPVNRPPMVNNLGETLPLRTLPTTVTEDYQKWTLVERVGNFGFFEVRSVTGGKRLYSAQLIMVDENNKEFIKTPIWEDESDPFRPKDHIPRQYNQELVYADFLKMIENNEKAIQRRQRETEEKRQAEILQQKNVRILRESAELIAHNQTELREICDKSENLQGIMSNKRAKELLTSLAQLRMLNDHFKVL